MEKEFNDIILAKLNGKSLSDEEGRIFEEWYTEAGNRKRFYELQRLQSAIHANYPRELNVQVAWDKLNRKIQPRRKVRIILRYAAAAVMLLGFSAVFHFLSFQENTTPQQANQTENVIPGKKQATLTLSTGEQIILSDTNSRIHTQEQGVTINNNQHVLEYNQSEATSHFVYNTINIPRGGEYVLALADGTKIWLNSESRITYPVAFSGTIREVNLEGEAYFEIAKDTTKPFIVHTREFDIRVTGTQFNVRTYPQEPGSTTLAEGRVQLERAGHISRLIPGQQATLINEKIEIKETDIEEAIAWRYEAFCFKQRTLESILNELARWYDMDIFYQNPDTRNYHFTAWFKRSSSIEEVIQILEKTQKIKMQLTGKTLTVKDNSENK